MKNPNSPKTSKNIHTNSNNYTESGKKNNSTAKVTPELLKKIQTDAENNDKSALKLGDTLILFSESALPCFFCCTYTKFISTFFLVTNKL